MPEIKNINVKSMLEDIDHQVEFGINRVKQAAAKAIADVNQAAAALGDLPQGTGELMAHSTVALVGEAEFRGDRYDTTCQMQLSVVGRQYGNNIQLGSCQLPGGKYRILVAFLPLKGGKEV